MKLPNRFPFGRVKPENAEPAHSDGPVAPPARQPWPKIEKKKKDGDLGIAILGIALGLACALFPWYIFFNQEKFGIKKFVFDGSRSQPTEVAYQPPLIRAPFTSGQIPRMDVDLFPTGTLQDHENPRRPTVADQPFPADLVSFKLVHVANGRAMIEDDAGLWVVQRGSRLPDASEVASIEQREGRWVLVTTLDKVVELEP